MERYMIQQIMLENMANPQSAFRKRNRRKVKAFKNSLVVINSWNVEKCQDWLVKRERQNFLLWHKYRNSVENRLEELGGWLF